MSVHKDSKEIAPMVRYEWDMVKWTFQELLRNLDYLYGDDVGHLFAGTGGIVVTAGDDSSGHGVPDPDAWSLLENFLLHARVLRDFFQDRNREQQKLTDRYKKSPDALRGALKRLEDDLFASDFMDDEFRFMDNEDPLEFLRTGELRTRLNKALAHLSFDRIEYEKDKDWDIQRVFDGLSDAWEQFWNLLPAECRSWFISRIPDSAFDDLNEWIEAQYC